MPPLVRTTGRGMIRGLDLSSANGTHPFDGLKASDYAFVILKGQEGNKGFDPFFEKNCKAALAAGIEPFAYCFPYPLPDKAGVTGRSPAEQARLFVDSVYRYPELAGRPIFVDLEWPPPNEWAKWGCTADSVSTWCKTLCEEIVRLSGVKPVIYTYPWWWAELSKAKGGVAWAADYALWLAAYVKKQPVDGDKPRVPAPWQDWLFWQWDGDGGAKLPNGADADFCVYNGTLEDLKALCPVPARAA